MGRRRSKRFDLPPGVHERAGRWYYGRNHVALGPAGPGALAKWAELAGERYTPTRPTVTDAIRDYRLHELGSKATKTRAEYTRQFVLLERVFGRVALVDLQPVDVRKYLTMRPRIAGTREKALLSAVFNVARGRGLTAAPNPCAGIRGTKARRDRYVTDAELATAIERAEPMLGAFLELCYRTGQRPGDVLRMRRADVQDGALWVQQGKTGAKVRIALVGPLQALLGRLPVASLWLVHDARGQRITLAAMRKRFDRLDVDWQIRDLRAKAASDAESALAAQTLLGHAAATTTDGYIRQRAGRAAAPIVRKLRED